MHDSLCFCVAGSHFHLGAAIFPFQGIPDFLLLFVTVFTVVIPGPDGHCSSPCGAWFTQKFLQTCKGNRATRHRLGMSIVYELGGQGERTSADAQVLGKPEPTIPSRYVT